MKKLRMSWMVSLTMSGLLAALGCAHHRERVVETHTTTVYHETPPAVAVPEPPPAATTFHYYYYPDEEVYFDPVARLYWWKEDGEWHSGDEVPARIHLRERDRVILDVPESEPWRHHEVIIKEYPRHHRHDED